MEEGGVRTAKQRVVTSMDHDSHKRRPDRDRRARQADRLARILSVLRLIQSRGQWNAKRNVSTDLRPLPT